jgi:hypothetical protein
VLRSISINFTNNRIYKKNHLGFYIQDRDVHGGAAAAAVAVAAVYFSLPSRRGAQGQIPKKENLKNS